MNLPASPTCSRPREQNRSRQRAGRHVGTHAYQQWKDPAIKKCAAVVHKAYPSDIITPPVNPNTQIAGTDTTFQSVIEGCQYLGLFAKIADAAGKHLTVATFTKAGLRAEERHHPRDGWTDLLRPGAAVRRGSGDSGDLRLKTYTLVPASIHREMTESFGVGAKKRFGPALRRVVRRSR